MPRAGRLRHCRRPDPCGSKMPHVRWDVPMVHRHVLGVCSQQVKPAGQDTSFEFTQRSSSESRTTHNVGKSLELGYGSNAPSAGLRPRRKSAAICTGSSFGPHACSGSRRQSWVTLQRSGFQKTASIAAAAVCAVDGRVYNGCPEGGCCARSSHNILTAWLSTL